MDLYRKMKEAVLESEFKIQVGENYVSVVGYTKMKEISSKSMTVIAKEKEVEIKGRDMAVQKLVTDEVFITGKIDTISLRGNHE